MKTSKIIKIALIQMTSSSNPEHNFSFISSAISKAAQNSAIMAFLPENFHYMSSKDSSFSPETLEGPIIKSYQELAKKNKIWLSLGGFQEKPLEGLKQYNTHLLIDQEGEIKASYHKIHLFDADIDPNNIIRESSIVKPGELNIIVAETPLGKTGLSVCYDLRFPELYRKQVVEQKANVLLIPAAFFVPTGKAHWEVLLRARAIENTCFVIAAAQSGRHNEGRASYGHSMVVDPWGDVLLDMGEEVGVGFVEIDMERINDVRKKLPCLNHQKLVKN